MYAPNLMPSNVHHLWLQNESSVKQSTNNNRHQTDEDSYQTSSTNYAPPLSSYSSSRPGAVIYTRPSSSHAGSYSAGSDIIQSDIEEKLRHLKSIRTLGYSYISPLGLGKTMETLTLEAEMKRQMNEQFQTEATSAENLLGEAEIDQHQQLQQQQQQIPPQAAALSPQAENSESFNQNQSSNIPYPPVQLETPNTSRTETQLPQPPIIDQVDLDDEIPDAEENSYNGYNDSDTDEDGHTFERQYDRGFMVSEQYESQEVNDNPQTYETPVRETVQFDTNNNAPNTGSTLANQSGHLSGLHSSGIVAESSFDEQGDVSFNGSDLDMTID